MEIDRIEKIDGQTERFSLKKLIGIQVISHGHGNIEYRELI